MISFWKKTVSLLLSAVLAVTMLTACSGGDQSGTSSTEGSSTGSGDTITIGLSTEIVSLDPNMAYDTVTNPVATLTTEGLVKCDYDGKVSPWLAESVEQPDNLTYIFTLREGVTFWDGTEMTAEDAAYSLNRCKDPATASPLGWMFDNVESIEATDERTVTIKMKTADSAFLQLMGTTAGRVYSKAYCEAHSEDFGTAEGGIMATGPYKVVEWQTGTQVSFVKYDNYWNEEAAAKIPNVVFKFIKEPSSIVAGLKSGQLDMTLDLATDMLSTITTDSNLQIGEIESQGFRFLAFNTQKAPFDDPNVRKAITCMLDRETMATNIYGGYADAGNSIPVPYNMFEEGKGVDWAAYVEECYEDYPYDVEKAKEFLAQSDYPDGFSCTLTLNSENQIYMNTALMIQDALKELNIEVEILPVTHAESLALQFGTGANGRDFDMFLSLWDSDYSDPMGNILPVFASSGCAAGGSNTSNYQNPELDAILEAQNTATEEERQELIKQALDILREDCPMPTLVFAHKNWVANKRIGNINVGAAWLWNFPVNEMTITE